MQFVNYTPFPPFVFQSEDVERRPFVVVLLRGTFAIDEGQPLRLVPEQEPVVRADRYRGELNRSSLLVDSDLAPYKPRTDIHVEATAFSPAGEPLPSWLVRVQVGSLDKSLRVTGPRSFRYAGQRWTLSEPKPCASVPITYEHAFGGQHVIDGVAHVDERNPVGAGFWPPEAHKANRPSDELPAPRIEAPEQPVRDFGGPYLPQGLGPIARAWLPRRALAGTFDERWQRERWPALPLDFDFAHYNSAHPDLIYPGYLVGDEPVCLEGLDPNGPQRFALPGHTLTVCLIGPDWPRTETRCELDTLRLDLPRRRASVTWRARAYGPELPERVVAYMDPISQPTTQSLEHHG